MGSGGAAANPRGRSVSKSRAALSRLTLLEYCRLIDRRRRPNVKRKRPHFARRPERSLRVIAAGPADLPASCISADAVGAQRTAPPGDERLR